MFLNLGPIPKKRCQDTRGLGNTALVEKLTEFSFNAFTPTLLLLLQVSPLSGVALLSGNHRGDRKDEFLQCFLDTPPTQPFFLLSLTALSATISITVLPHCATVSQVAFRCGRRRKRARAFFLCDSAKCYKRKRKHKIAMLFITERLSEGHRLYIKFLL